jgi:uncharacterized membrane protein
MVPDKPPRPLPIASDDGMFPDMTKNRLEAFSDGVIAILITIMVLEFKVPRGTDWSELLPLVPTALSYALSFIMLGIYWNNHHHMLHSVSSVNGAVLWANLHLLFWLSLVPFVTAWVGEHEFAQVPVMAQGVVMELAGVAYFILTRALLAHQGRDSKFARALGRDAKGVASMVLYPLGIALTFWHPWFGFGAYVVVAMIWLVPDRRFEVHKD